MTETAVHLIFRRNLTIWPNIGCTVLVCQAVESFLFHGSNEIFRCFLPTFSFSVWKVSFLKSKGKSQKVASLYHDLFKISSYSGLFSRKIIWIGLHVFIFLSAIKETYFNFNFLTPSKLSEHFTSKISILCWLACFKK